MTDHHHPGLQIPVIHHPEGREVRVLYTVDEYLARDERRMLVLADFPRLGLTLFDVCAESGADQHLVAEHLENLDDVACVAEAHIDASRAEGRPALDTAEPPTEEQLHWLRQKAERIGATFTPPRNRAEARKWIRRSRPGIDTFDPVRAARETWEGLFAGVTS